MSSSARPIRVLVADDHQIIRQSLTFLLKNHPGIQVVGEAADGQSAVSLASDLSPDVVVMDVRMPGVDGFEATRRITNGNGHGPKVLALSAHADGHFVGEMLGAGASGYVTKDASFAELTEAIREVVAGNVYLSPLVANDALREVKRAGTVGRSAGFALSTREREVLQLVADGKAMKQIANTLNVSVKTVESRRRRIMVKLGIDSVAGLTRYAIREGLTAA